MTSQLEIISAAVDILRLANIGLAEWQKVSDTIGARIAANRDDWTEEEKAAIQTALDEARATATNDVNDLPE
jgi:hypothetical protein